jgi:hypothetical protein
VKVISRRSLGRQRVYWITTETHNYVAYGFGSANSQMMCTPMPGREQFFSPTWRRWGHIDWHFNQDEPAFIIERDSYDKNIRMQEDMVPPPRVVPLSMMSVAGILDPAPSEATEKRQEPNARNGLYVAGGDPWGRRYRLEAKGLRADYRDVIDEMFRLADKWGFDTWYVEEVIFSSVYRHWVQDDQRHGGLHENQYLRVVPVKPGKRDKDTRITSKIPGCRNGDYYTNREDTLELVQEEDEYPNGLTKDLLDAQGYDHHILRPESPHEASVRVQKDQRLPHPYTSRDPVTGY